MVGDRIRLEFEVRGFEDVFVHLATVPDNENGRGEMMFVRDWLSRAATLVSRSEKPLQVGEKALTADSRRVVEIVSIFERRGETFATVEITDRREYEVPFDTVRLDDLRRAPEGV